MDLREFFDDVTACLAPNRFRDALGESYETSIVAANIAIEGRQLDEALDILGEYWDYRARGGVEPRPGCSDVAFRGTMIRLRKHVALAQKLAWPGVNPEGPEP